MGHALAKPLGFSVDVEDRGIDVEAARRPRIAEAQRFDELAPRVGVAASARAAGALHAVVGRRAVAHHAAQLASSEQVVDVVGVPRRRVDEARISMVPLDEPERGCPDPERVQGVEERHAGRVERGEVGAERALHDVGGDGIEEIDDAAGARGEGVGGERDALLSRRALHALPGDGVVVVVDDRLDEQLVAEDAAIEHLVLLGRGVRVLVAVLAGARLALNLADHELGGL